MCNNHPMFQFLFDSTGKLLAANERAMLNMKGALAWDVHLAQCINAQLRCCSSISVAHLAFHLRLLG